MAVSKAVTVRRVKGGRVARAGALEPYALSLQNLQALLMLLPLPPPLPPVPLALLILYAQLVEQVLAPLMLRAYFPRTATRRTEYIRDAQGRIIEKVEEITVE